MKKILLIISVIICLISNLIFLPASAESVDPGSLVYYPLSDFQNENNYDSTQFYFYVMYKRNESTNFTYTGYIQVDESKIESVECIDGIYHIEFVENVSLCSRTNTHSTPGKSSFSSEHRFSVKSITYQPGLRCYFFDSTGDQTYPMFSDCIFYDCQTNMFGTPTQDLEFEFIPELTGLVDYKNFTYNNVEMKDYPYFRFSVTNKNLNHNYQYSFFIVDKGNKITYDDVPALDIFDEFTDESIYKDHYNNGQFFSNSPIFTYITDEWGYSAFGASLSGNPKLCLSPSSWHLVKAGETVTVNIDWRQMKLEPGRDYDCVVVACKKDCFLPDNKYDDTVVNFISSFQAYNRSSPDEAYRSSFTVKSATPFDPNFTYVSDDGITSYSYDPDSDNSSTFDKLFSSYDDEHGYTRVEGDFTSFDPSNPSKPKPNSGSSGGSFGSGQFVSSYLQITSFSGMFSSVFGFVSTFMNYLPAQIMLIYIFGFSCIVVVAIIKAVR